MRKKQLILLPILVMILCPVAKAQFSFGLKLGMNVANISNYNSINVPNAIVAPFTAYGDNSYRIGYNAGLFLNYAISDNFLAFQPELLFSNQGMKYTGDILGIPNSSFEATIKTDYINIPLMIQLYFIKKVLYVEAGPQLGFLVSSTANYEAVLAGVLLDDSWDIRDELNTVDFSFALGFGFQFPALPIGLNARYTIGVTNVSKDANNDGTYNNVFQLGAFLKF